MSEDEVDVAVGDDDALVSGPEPDLPAAPVLDLSCKPTMSAKGCLADAHLSRKEKRKQLKKLRRKQLRQQAAEEEKLGENDVLDDTAEQLRIQLEEQLEAEVLAKEQAEHDEQERLWLEREKKAMEDFQRQQEELKKLEENKKLQDEEEDSGYVEDDGPAEIIWKGNEIIVKKRRVKVPAETSASPALKDANQPTSNPLPPQTAAFAAHYKYPRTPDVNLEPSMFGTEQDKTHCPFHIKTGVCRFGVRCSRVHVYPDQSFTLLMRNMYTGPGLTWENDEGLESNKLFKEDGKRFQWLDEGKRATTVHSDEEVAQQYEEFYGDVHSEFLRFGEIVNFKVCQNESLHLRGNVYVHYKTEAAAQAAYSAINGRFFASKQITCEFVGVTRWRIALCGEYMKGHHRPCSHGTACNFLHCFRNPGGEYDWADWDSSPPFYWRAKMAKLFGYDDDLEDGDDDEFHDNVQRRHWPSNSPRRRESLHRDRRSSDIYRQSTPVNFDHASGRRGRRHENGGDHNRSDSDDPERSLRHRSHRSRASRHYSASKDVDASRSRGRTHENGGDYYRSDFDDSQRSSRHRSHRSRDSRHYSASKEVDERGRGNGRDLQVSSEDEAGSRDYHELTGDMGEKPFERHNTGSQDVNEECAEEVILGSKQLIAQDRSGSESDPLQERGKDSKHRIKMRRSRYLKDHDNRQSLDLSSSRDRHRSTLLETENSIGQIGLETEYDARKRKHYSKRTADLTLVHRRTDGHSDEDGGSGDVHRSHKRSRRDHQKPGKRKRSTSRKSSYQVRVNQSKANQSPDKDDRWTGNMDS